MLAERGVEVTVIAPRDRTFELLIAMGCRCVELPVASKGTNPRDDLRTLVALYRQYRAMRPHVVFHYTIKPNIYGSIAAKLAGVPSIAVTTGLGYVFIQQSRTAHVAKKLYRFAFRFPREVWFLNRDDQRRFRRAEPACASRARASAAWRRGRSRTVRVHAAAATRAHFVFMLIGRLLWDKGVAEYVEAARRLRAKYPHARFQLLGPVGVDNPSAISRTEVDAWQREGVIEYLGEAHDVRPHIAERGLRRVAVLSRRRAAHADGSVGDGPADRRDRCARLPRSGRGRRHRFAVRSRKARTVSPARSNGCSTARRSATREMGVNRPRESRCANSTKESSSSDIKAQYAPLPAFHFDFALPGDLSNEYDQRQRARFSSPEARASSARTPVSNCSKDGYDVVVMDNLVNSKRAIACAGREDHRQESGVLRSRRARRSRARPHLRRASDHRRDPLRRVEGGRRIGGETDRVLPQ